MADLWGSDQMDEVVGLGSGSLAVGVACFEHNEDFVVSLEMEEGQFVDVWRISMKISASSHFVLKGFHFI